MSINESLIIKFHVYLFYLFIFYSVIPHASQLNGACLRVNLKLGLMFSLQLGICE